MNNTNHGGNPNARRAELHRFALTIRLRLKQAGYAPLPLHGKAPAPKKWQQLNGVTDAEMKAWASEWPDAFNTGILTRDTPAFDADIRNEAAAAAIETLVRERFGPAVLSRVGQAPKRAFLFRTDAPFSKITVNFRGSEKLEFLGNGQQLAAHGIHPDTRKPYQWFNGEPGEVKRDELVLITQAEARTLVEDVAELLISQFGYERGSERPRSGPDGAAGDWQFLIDRIHDGEALHDSLRDLAFETVRAGMPAAAAISLLRALMNGSAAAKDERWRERYDDIPRAVGTAVEKFGPKDARVEFEGLFDPDWKPRGKTGTEAKDGLPLLTKAEFLGGFIPPDYLVKGVLQRRFVYSCTGKTGDGKTALALDLMTSVAAAVPTRFGPHTVKRGRAVYFVGENPDDIRMRVIGADAQRMDDPSTDQALYIPGVFDIDGLHATLVEQVNRHGPVDLVIVDTSAAYFLGDDEISNPQMGEHARKLRRLTTLPGGPCVVVLCHPIKHATDPSQLQPRGGGAFLNEMDGNLWVWRYSDEVVTLHHDKMRGPGFEPMEFRLEKITSTDLVDSDGDLIPTVRAVAMSEDEVKAERERLHSDEDALLAAMLDHPGGSIAELAQACGWFVKDGNPAKARVQRRIDRLAKEVAPKLIRKKRDRWQLTAEGEKAARGVKMADTADE
jgi:hypothetical protein